MEVAYDCAFGLVGGRDGSASMFGVSWEAADGVVAFTYSLFVAAGAFYHIDNV